MRIALCLLAAAGLAGCSMRNDIVDSSVVRGRQLSPCTAEGTTFAELELKDWAPTYHRRVGEVVDEFFQQESDDMVIDCKTLDEGDGSPPAPAGSALLALARDLPPWADAERPVTRLSTGDVLRTYLDSYLCSLAEARLTITLTATGESGSGSGVVSEPRIGEGVEVDRGDLSEWIETDTTTIDRELATAEPALERVLTLMSADHRTAGLKTELQCLLRASTDLRNALALFSEAAACVGRLWDAQGIVRDFPAFEAQ